MKKLLALLITAILILGMAPIVAAEEINILINKTFENEVTGNAPSGFSAAKYGNISVILDDGRNKFIYMKNGDAANIVTTSVVSEAKYIIFETSIKLEDGKSVKSFLINDKSVADIYSTHVKLTNGSKISVKRGEYVDLKIRYNTSSGRYEIFVNDIRESRLLSGDKSISSAGFRSEAVSEGATGMMVDYLRVYESGRYAETNEFPKVTFNEKKRDVNLEISGTVQGNVIYSQNFQELNADAKRPPSMTWYGDVSIRTEENGNKYMLLNHSESARVMVDLDLKKEFYKVVFSADVKMDNAEHGTLFEMKDASGKFFSKLRFSAGGIYADGNNIKAYKTPGEWTNIALCMNLYKKTYSIYINGAEASNSLSYQNFSENITLVRFLLADGDFKESMAIDNIKIYEGDKPLIDDTSDENETQGSEDTLGYEVKPLKFKESAFTAIETDVINNQSKLFNYYEGAVSELKNTFVMVADNETVLLDGKKYKAAAKPYYKYNEIYVPVRVLGDAFGKNISWDGEKGRVLIGDVSLSTGEKVIHGKEDIKITYPIENKNGTVYAPVAELSKALGIFSYISEKGAIILADYVPVSSSGSAFEELADDIFNYVVYERPSASTLAEIFEEKKLSGVHPRVRVTESELQRMKKSAETDPVVRSWSENVIKSADAYKVVNPQYVFDSAGRVTEGISERNVFTLFWAWYMTGDDKYYEKAKQDTLAQVYNFNDWHPAHFLDTAQKIASMATMYDLFYHKMDDETKSLIGEAIVEKGLKPAYESYYGKGESEFPLKTSNWNVICNGMAAIGAMAVADEYESQMCFDIIEKGLKSSELMMTQFAPDGSWFEGPSYWHYLMMYMVPYFDALERVFDSNFGLMDVPGMKETGYYLMNISGNSGAFSYHDSPINYKGNVMETFWFAKHLGDASLARARLNEMEKTGTKGTILDILYFDGNAAENVVLPNDSFYSNSGVATSRSGRDDAAAFLAIHSGYNEVSHGQIDMGSFEYEVFGTKFASDSGKDDYALPGYYDLNHGDRYEYYVNRAEAHNLYVINPDISPGQERDAGSEIYVADSNDNGIIYSIDMTPAYRNQVIEAKRGFMLSQKRTVLTVQDEIVPKQSGDIFLWFWQSPQQAQLIDEKTIKLGKGSAYVMLHVDANVDFDISIGKSKPLDTSPRPEGQLNGFKEHDRICIEFTSGDKPIKLRVTAVPFGKLYKGEEITDISSWSIEEENAYENPAALKGIYSNGKLIEGFSKDKYSYTIKTDKVPEISVESDFKTEIVQATREDAFASILVFDENEPENMSLYSINFDISGVFESKELNKPKITYQKVVASDEPEPENAKENVFDDDLNTRWSAEGEQHLIVDLENEKTISGIGIATYLGDERVLKMHIYHSADGVNYNYLMPANTSGTTKEMEYLSFAPVSARYVKIVFMGTSQSEWSSVTELNFY